MQSGLKWVVVAGLIALASPVAAQTPAALERGRMSLAFVVPDAHSGEVSIWRFASDRTNLGISLAFGATGIESDSAPDVSNWNVRVGPALKRYFAPRARVAPFLRAGLSVGYAHSELDGIGAQQSYSGFDLGASGAVGVDWFASDDISIGGHTGLRASANWSDSNDATLWSFGTATSGLTLHIYF